jgi:hypothetical protein
MATLTAKHSEDGIEWRAERPSHTANEALFSSIRAGVTAYCAATQNYAFDPQNPIVRLGGRKEQPVAHPVEGTPHGEKALRRGSQQGIEPVLAGERVVGCHAEAAASQRVVVRDRRTGFPEVSRGDIIGKEAGEPEGVVAQMEHHAKSALARARLEIDENVHQIAVALVVVPVHAPRPVALAELQQKRSEIVGQIAVVHPGVPERVPHDHEEKQRLGRDEHRPYRQQALQQVGGVQQGIRPLRGQPPLQVCSPVRTAPAQQQDYQLQVRRGQAAPHIRPNHA